MKNKYRLTAAVTAAVLLLTAAGCGGNKDAVSTETRESRTETQLCTTEPETERAKTTETESAPVSETVTEKKTVRTPERQTEPVRETEPERTTESAAEFPGAVYPLSYNEYTLLCSVVMAEAGDEPFEGQKAVAQCILNACRREGQRPDAIIDLYGYTKQRPLPSDSVKAAVEAVFTNGETVVDMDVLYFYAPAYTYSAWHESQQYAYTIGGHRFFKPSK